MAGRLPKSHNNSKSWWKELECNQHSWSSQSKMTPLKKMFHNESGGGGGAGIWWTLLGGGELRDESQSAQMKWMKAGGS